MAQVYRSGSYGKIYYDHNRDEVTKIHHRVATFLGIPYPCEYDITCRLDHPHLIKAKRITSEGYLVFNYYPFTLWHHEILSLPLVTRQDLLKQLYSAVAYLHDQGYLHLDLKGDNILVKATNTTYHLVLADFGGALFIGREDGKKSSRNLILDHLKAPELLESRIKGKLKMTFRRASDYWSLGMISFEVLTGTKLNYQTKSQLQLYEENQHAALKLRFSELCSSEDVTRLWQDWLHDLLQDHWQDRRLPGISQGWVTRTLTKTKSSSTITDGKDFITTFAMKLLPTSGHERVEAFILGLDLYRRVKYRLHVDDDTLLLTCYWLAIKLVEGVSVDPFEIDPYDEGGCNKYLWKIELDIIRELMGSLYQPNFFTLASCKQDLLVAWRYLYSRHCYHPTFEIRKFPGKADYTLRQYLYDLDLKKD